jgi:3-hydroxybutyryl-CoA dehydrogenase
MTAIQTVGVLGCGQMGSGIAQVAAVGGCQVLARDIDEAMLAKGRAAIEASLARFVDKGKLDTKAREAALGRIRFTTRLEDLAHAELVVEAVTEDLELKNRLWTALDPMCPAETIFASNTSSLSIMAMAVVTGRAERFIGLHFFNPVPMMPLVEVVRTVASSPEALSRATELVRRIGKEPVAAKDSAGFIVNRLLIPYMLDAIRAVENGVASIEDIDLGMKLGCGHPMGPLMLLDFVGLDTSCRVAEIMFEEFREARYAPPPLLKRMVLAGWLGKKSGKGFYDWSHIPPVPRHL